jgi:hypothetical protein
MLIRRPEWLLSEGSTVHFSNLRAANTQTVLAMFIKAFQDRFSHIRVSVFISDMHLLSLHRCTGGGCGTRGLVGLRLQLPSTVIQHCANCVAKDHQTAKQRPANLIHGASCQESTGPLAWLGKHASTTRVEPKQTSFSRD